MKEQFYFTADDTPHGLQEELQGKFDDGEYSDEPDDLADGTLYRVTIEKVGVVRTTREVEFDTALAKESD